jgi:hypothetical protein
MGEKLARMEFFIFLVMLVREFSVAFPDGLEPAKLEGNYKLVYEPHQCELLIQKRTDGSSHIKESVSP